MLYDQETRPVIPAGFTLGATGFAGTEMAAAIRRSVVPRIPKCH
jgi:hypothetical protein